jgi:hypothetical protein
VDRHRQNLLLSLRLAVVFPRLLYPKERIAETAEFPQRGRSAKDSPRPLRLSPLQSKFDDQSHGFSLLSQVQTILPQPGQPAPYFLRNAA